MKGFIRGVVYFTVLIGGVVISAKAANKVHGLFGDDKEEDNTSSESTNESSDTKSEE